MTTRDRYGWLRKYIEQLKGRTIVATGVNEEGFPLLILDNGVQVSIARDEEGNGPGWIEGLPYQK